MGSKASKDDGLYATVVPINSTTKSTRLALTTASATLTADKLVVNALYKFGLDPSASGSAWIDLDGGTAVAPASDADATAGFWLMPGEREIVKASTNLVSGIMLAGTGTLLITRLST